MGERGAVFCCWKNVFVVKFYGKKMLQKLNNQSLKLSMKIGKLLIFHVQMRNYLNNLISLLHEK